MNLEDTLQSILSTMVVPEQRKTDWNWLHRNLASRNLTHPKLNEALRIVKQLQLQWVKKVEKRC
jgi:hypothetical protein